MDIDNRLKMVRKLHFETGGLIVASVLGFFGLSFLIFSFFVVVGYFGEIYSILGLLLIFGVFFFFLSLYIWYKFFINIILKPKKEVLFLEKDEDDELCFIDRKGRFIEYDEEINLKENCYYDVIKTADYVLLIIGESHGDWTSKKKMYFWRTWYTPIGCFKNIVLLPILYVAFLVSLVLFFFSTDIFKYFSLTICFPCIFFIGYDIYYKILNRNK